MSHLREAPKSHSQPSRKGKRAWRKNVDITEVTRGLASAQDEEIATGKKAVDIATVPADELFQVDIAGDEIARTKARQTHGLLKVDQILAQRSAVPAVASRKRPNDGLVTDGVIEKKAKRGSGVKAAEYHRLRRVAFAGEKSQQSVVKVGDQPVYDPWANEPEKPKDPKFSFLNEKKPVRAPETIQDGPRALTSTGKTIPNVRKPNAGRSYNPAFHDWQNLLAREGEKEVAAERKRLREAELEAERLERVAKSAEEADRAERAMHEDDELMSAYESEWEGIQSDIEEAQLKKKRPERKTPVERNKIKRRKEAQRQAKHDALMVEREKQAKKIDELRKAVDEKEKLRKETMLQVAKFGNEHFLEDSDEEEEDLKLRRDVLKRNKVPVAPLEVVLPEELQDSLRRLKPEGNLLRDRYRTMVIQGRTEARKPASMHKQKKGKVTEKWSHKDFRLPSDAPRTVA